MGGIGPVTEHHLTAFGAIMHEYAKAESGFRLCIGGICGLSIPEALVLTEPYSALALRNVAKTLSKRWDGPEKYKMHFVQMLGEHGKFGPLRNAIGHSRWIEGDRRESIKPLAVDIRSGSLKVSGRHDGNRDWTSQELTDEAMKINRLNQKLGKFMKEVGFEETLKAKNRSSSVDE